MRGISDRLFVVCMLFAVSILSCKNDAEVAASAIPEIINSELHFRGFVTDEDEELVSSIHNFTKKVTRRDTVDGRNVFAYVSNDREFFSYTDENGTVWERTTTDVGARIATYGFSYRQPVIVTTWEALLKLDQGVGTEWSVEIDTTFSALTMAGQTEAIRYIKKGKARYEGWVDTFLPDEYKNVKVMGAHWYDLDIYIINETTSDTLFATEGEAHHYFVPKLGGVKYITNFVKSELDQPNVPLRGTWELMSRDIPGEQKAE